MIQSIVKEGVIRARARAMTLNRRRVFENDISQLLALQYSNAYKTFLRYLFGYGGDRRCSPNLFYYNAHRLYLDFKYILP